MLGKLQQAELILKRQLQWIYCFLFVQCYLLKMKSYSEFTKLDIVKLINWQEAIWDKTNKIGSFSPQNESSVR